MTGQSGYQLRFFPQSNPNNVSRLNELRRTLSMRSTREITPQTLFRMGRNPDTHLLVAVAESDFEFMELRGEIIAMGLLMVKDILIERVGEIRSVVIDPRLTRRGIGRAMVRKLVETGWKNDLDRIEVVLGETREAAHQLYELEGFERTDRYKWRILRTGAQMRMAAE